MNVKQLNEGKEIADTLVGIKARLGALGLFKTMHALDAATRAIGYELAEHCEALDVVTPHYRRQRAWAAKQFPSHHNRKVA